MRPHRLGRAARVERVKESCSGTAIASIKTHGKSAVFIDHNIFHVYPVVDRLYLLDRGIELVLMNGTGVALRANTYPVMSTIFTAAPFGIPIQTIWAVVIGIALWLLLNRTRFGTHVFLVGDNATSARLMGSTWSA
jgi:predicted ABC-type sugar transport system permease subunit